MNKAETYLNPKPNTKRKVVKVSQGLVDKHRLDIDDDFIERPKNRAQCPSMRPCPYVGCRYHLYLDINSPGELKMNFHGIGPEDMRWSCALDIAEEQEGIMSLANIGEYMGLTRERVRNILNTAQGKMHEALESTHGTPSEGGD